MHAKNCDPNIKHKKRKTIMLFLTELLQAHDRKIILASQSPRRIEILRSVGLRFTIRPALINEDPGKVADEFDYVRTLAAQKAEWVWQRNDADLVIAADTIVVKDGQIFEKPGNREEARETLRKFSGAAHTVVTGLHLKTRRSEILDHEETRVHFYPLSEAEIEIYLNSGESFDKAGGYGIQGFASVFVQKVEGCYFNVVGFPLGKFYQHLKSLEF